MHKNTSTSLVGEMQIKTTDTTLYLLEWLIPKRQKIINVGEGVEKREPLYTVGAATMKSSMESLQKIKNNTTIGQSFLLVYIYPKNITLIQKDLCTPVFSEALFIIAKI